MLLQHDNRSTGNTFIIPQAFKHIYGLKINLIKNSLAGECREGGSKLLSEINQIYHIRLTHELPWGPSRGQS